MSNFAEKIVICFKAIKTLIEQGQTHPQRMVFSTDPINYDNNLNSYFLFVSYSTGFS